MGKCQTGRELSPSFLVPAASAKIVDKVSCANEFRMSNHYAESCSLYTLSLKLWPDFMSHFGPFQSSPSSIGKVQYKTVNNACTGFQRDTLCGKFIQGTDGSVETAKFIRNSGIFLWFSSSLFRRIRHLYTVLKISITEPSALMVAWLSQRNRDVHVGWSGSFMGLLAPKGSENMPQPTASIS